MLIPHKMLLDLIGLSVWPAVVVLFCLLSMFVYLQPFCFDELQRVSFLDNSQQKRNEQYAEFIESTADSLCQRYL